MSDRQPKPIKRCPSFPGYSVQEQTVISHWTRAPGFGPKHVIDYRQQKQLKGCQTVDYIKVYIKRGDAYRPVAIHILITDAYLGPRPDGLEIRHLDGDKLNNDIRNLCYGTKNENAQDRIDHGGQVRGEACPWATLTEDQVREILAKYIPHQCTRPMLAREYGVSKCVIDQIVDRKNWRHITTGEIRHAS